MNEFRILLHLEMRSHYGFNKFLHSKDQKSKKRYAALGVVWLFLAALVVSYVVGLTYGLCFLGLADIVPAFLAVMASLLILAFGIFAAGSRIFAQRGYDILSSLPVKPGAIVASRFWAMYLENLALCFMIFLPGMITYGSFAQVSAGSWIIALTGFLFVPAIPVVLSTLLGTAILAVSSRMKNKSLVQSALMVLLVIAVMAGSFRMESATADLTPEHLRNLADSAFLMLKGTYPPAFWLGEAVRSGNVGYLARFLMVSVGLIAAGIAVISRNYSSISRRLRRFSAKHSYQVGAMERSHLLKALWFRELKRYFSSSIYVTNTIIGPILAAIMSVTLCVTGVDAVQKMIPLPLDISEGFPFLFSCVFCMMTASSTALSMEGRQFWIVKSMPIPGKALLDSKLLMNLSLMLPFYLISEVSMVVAFKPGFLPFLWQLLVPAVVILFSLVFGITVNLHWYSLDWEKEEYVVKQSLSAMLGGFGGVLLSAAFGGIVFLIPLPYREGIKGLLCLMMIVLTAYLYQKNSRTDLTKLS